MIFIRYPLVWSQAVVDKIWQKHSVSVEEVEEVIFNSKPICHKGASNSYCVYGQAISGRRLFVVLRKIGKGVQYKVITAREMQEKEKRYYEKRRT